MIFISYYYDLIHSQNHPFRLFKKINFNNFILDLKMMSFCLKASQHPHQLYEDV